jgi:thioester reductase-like protein
MLAEETVFITGFPGFIAARLLRRLARGGGRFFLLVQPSFVDVAKSEVERIAAETGTPSSDFVLLPGDITQPNLGLSAEDLRLVRDQTTIVFHLAALYDLAVAEDVARQVNVAGTHNVNELARSLPKLKHYHYVSTCYVAGKRTGRILETELQHDKGFRNFYEETKYQAELEVERLKSELPVTIHRPAVVVGDSVTGETAKFDGIYYLILYLAKWPGVLATLNIGNEDVALNLVPVDFVVDAMASLANDPKAVGKTIQLADPAPLSTRELFDAIANCLAVKKSNVTLPKWLVYSSLMLPFTPAISGLPHSAVPYFFLNQSYDTSEARQLLEPYGITCPPVRRYMKTIVDYAVDHQKN